MSRLGRLFTTTVNQNVIFDGTGAEWDTQYHTMMAWCQRDVAETSSSWIGARNNHSGLAFTGGNIFSSFIRHSGVSYFANGGAITNGRLYHVAATFDGTTLKTRVYDSTTRVATNYTSTHTGIDNANADFLIGSLTAGQPAFGGFVAAMKRWQHASAANVLTDAQIDAERWQLLPRFRIQECLIAAPLGWGNPEPNLMSIGLTGTLTGSPTASTTLIPVAMRVSRRFKADFTLVALAPLGSSQTQTSPPTSITAHGVGGFALQAFPLDPSYYAAGTNNVLKHPGLPVIQAGDTFEIDTAAGAITPAGATVTLRAGGGGSTTAPGGSTFVRAPIKFQDANFTSGDGIYKWVHQFDEPVVAGDVDAPVITVPVVYAVSAYP